MAAFLRRPRLDCCFICVFSSAFDANAKTIEFRQAAPCSRAISANPEGGGRALIAFESAIGCHGTNVLENRTSSRSLQMHEATLQSVNRRLSTVAYAHLAQNRGNVNTHRLLGDDQLFGDLAVGKSAGDTGEHLGFPWRKGECGDALCQP